MNGVGAWHFLGPERTLRYAPHTPVALGETVIYDGTPILCQSGLHASVRVLDALNYAPSVLGLVLCRVRLGGVIVSGDDKLVATTRTVLGWCEADPILHEFACWNAEAALFGASRIVVPDPQSLQALQVKRAWMRGEATDADLAAARDAAWAAARDAAGNAAWLAARAAAGAAAWAAAGAAAEAAGNAAWLAAWAAAGAAERDAANTQLEAMALDAMGALRS